MEPEIIEQLEETQEEIDFQLDELTQALSTVALIDEARFDEISERVTLCQNQLQVVLSKLDENPESPLLTQLLTTVTELRTDQAKILAELDSLKSSLSRQRQSESEIPPTPPSPTPEQTESSGHEGEQSTDEPVPVEVPMPETPRRKRRVNLL